MCFALSPCSPVAIPETRSITCRAPGDYSPWAGRLSGARIRHLDRGGGVSTQAGFIRGAARSPGGKPIICLASTTDDGTSRIKPLLETGDGVGIARSDVHYVVTEYGIAYLFGKS